MAFLQLLKSIWSLNRSKSSWDKTSNPQKIDADPVVITDTNENSPNFAIHLYSTYTWKMVIFNPVTTCFLSGNIIELMVCLVYYHIWLSVLVKTIHVIKTTMKYTMRDAPVWNLLRHVRFTTPDSHINKLKPIAAERNWGKPWSTRCRSCSLEKLKWEVPGTASCLLPDSLK